MMRNKLIWPLIFTVPGIFILLVMGFWQLERLAWKEALIAERSTALQAPPMALPPLGGDLSDLNFRRIFVTGNYLADKNTQIQNRNQNSVRGVEIITAFQRIPTEGGGMVLINRGWVPVSKLDEMTTNPDATVRISGVVRLGPAGRNAFTPDNDAKKSIWYSTDPLEIAKAMAIKTQPLIVEADQAGPRGRFPVAGLGHYELKNNHLSYALTWFSLSFALGVIFLLFARKKIRNHD